MAGRPALRSPEREQAILNSLRIGNTKRASAAAADVSADTLARWIASDEVFSGAVEKAQADAELRYLAQIAKAARDGTWQAAAWWLERRRAQDYRQLSGMELTGRDGGPITTKDVTSDISDETKRKLRAWIDEKVGAEPEPAVVDPQGAGTEVR